VAKIREFTVKLRTYPDPFLENTEEKVEDFGAELRNVTEQMIMDMYVYGGVGLASLQVGVPERLFVIDVSENKDNPSIIINPEIIETSTEREPFEEGCLSVPGIRQDVVRPAEITLSWQDLDGNEYQKDFGGLEARVIQHELDHLNGILFIKRLTQMKKILIKKALKHLEGK
jgi:peptide deformylase